MAGTATRTSLRWWLLFAAAGDAAAPGTGQDQDPAAVIARRAGIWMKAVERCSTRAGHRSTSGAVEAAEDPHTAGVAFDRDCNEPRTTPGGRQFLVDAARGLGGLPKFHYGLRRSRNRPDRWDWAGDLGHVEWDPVDFGRAPARPSPGAVEEP